MAIVLALAACTNGTMTDKTASPFSENMPGLGSMSLPGVGDMWGETKAEKADDDWWSHYYGGK